MALVAAACWWVPLFLMLLALTLESLASSPARFRLLVAVLAAVILFVGFVLVGVRKPDRGGMGTARGLWVFNVVMMVVVAVGVVAFVFVPRMNGPMSMGYRRDVATVAEVAPASEMYADKNVTKRELVVKGMTCQGCVDKVNEALISVPGILSAEVDLMGASASIMIDVDNAPADSSVVEVVRDAGYNAWFQDESVEPGKRIGGDR
jgi:copper chaperone CopZ